MWRWTVLLCLIVYGHTSAQPVTDEDENARQTRQLDFDECCPCPSPGQSFTAQESSMSNGNAMFARARDIDDCPCRPRGFDSEGASSIFFPTSKRSDGNFVRPGHMKEDIKPLLHPEVDLASSVLQTLREATDEEYQDALARDAARSMAKEAEETIFGDTLPEASNGNIVTIIVHPKHSDSLDDDIPQETHVQESRCVHAPLDSVSTNLGQERVAQKPPSLREIFGLPKISKPAGLLDMDNGASNVQERLMQVDNDQVTNKSVLGLRKYAPFMKLDENMRESSMDMKSNVAVDTSIKKVPDFKWPSMKSHVAVDTSAKKVPDFKWPSMKSNVDVDTSVKKVPNFKWPSMKSNVDVDTSVKKVPDFKWPSIKSNVDVDTSVQKVPDFKWPSMNSNVDIDTSVQKLPDLKLPSVKNRLKDLISNGAVLESKDKTNSLPLIPKMRLNNPLFKLKGKNEEDLSLSPSNIHEQAKKSFFQTKSHLENILQNTRPVGLKTLLKLKDVEFVPLKDLVPKSADRSTPNRPKLVWPDIFKKRDTVTSSNMDKNTISVARSTEIIEKIPKSGQDETFDAEVSPSNVIEQIQDDNCNHVAFKTTEADDEDTEAKTASTEVIDSASSPSEIGETVSDKSKDFATSQSNESPDNTDDCNVKTLPDTETNLPQSIESSFENEARDNNEDELNFETSKEIIPVDARAENDPDSDFVSNDEDYVSNSNDADSITDSSNNKNDVLKPIDTFLENDDASLVNENTVTEQDCSQELPVSDYSKTLNINPSKWIKPTSLDGTLSSIKEKIAKHIENLKNPKTNPKYSKILDTPITSNIVENKETTPITDENVDSGCQNEEPIEVTTVKPDICNDDLKIKNEPGNDEVSMQDLQKISDDMLQEEQERESIKSTLNCNEPTQEITAPQEPMDVNSGENENTDSEQSANTQNDVIMDSQKVVDIVDENDTDLRNACQSDLTLPKQSFEQESDANVEASEVVINRTPQSNHVFSSPLLLNNVLQPKENDFNFNIPLPDIQDIKFPPLPTLDDIKHSFTNLFDKSERDVDENPASEAASMIDKSEILAPIMSTDASAKHFRSMLPPLRLEDVDLDILQLKPQSNLFSIIPKLDLHFFRPKLPLPTDLRITPLKLQSPFEDKSGLFGTSLSLGHNNPWENIPGLDDFGTRVKVNTQKIAKTLRKPDTLKHSLKSSHGIPDLSNTKHSLKSMQHTLESKFRGATIKPVNLQSNDLLEAISRNHEDVNDKLRALHVDFNDRLETMRNNLFDTSIFGSGESRSTKSFSTFSNKNRDKKFSLKSTQPQSLSSRRESKKTLKPRRPEKQRETRIGSSHGLQNKFKMPTAASVPVPRTIEVPELKATLTKSPGLGIQTTSGVNPIFQNIDASQPKESSISLWKQATKKLPITNTRLGKTVNTFKDSKIKVSFSTTPRPSLSTKLLSRKLSTSPTLSLTSNLGKSTGRLGQRLDHKGSPSEIKNSIISPPISSHLDQNNLESSGPESESRQTGALSSWKLGGRENLEQTKLSKELQSWPKVSEGAFLSKVKEAVKARMWKVNSPVTFKQADSGDNGGVLNSNTDMAQSASANNGVIDEQALKENVSYKCTMVCTKE